MVALISAISCSANSLQSIHIRESKLPVILTRVFDTGTSVVMIGSNMAHHHNRLYPAIHSAISLAYSTCGVMIVPKIAPDVSPVEYTGDEEGRDRGDNKSRRKDSRPRLRHPHDPSPVDQRLIHQLPRVVNWQPTVLALKRLVYPLHVLEAEALRIFPDVPAGSVPRAHTGFCTEPRARERARLADPPRLARALGIAAARAMPVARVLAAACALELARFAAHPREARTIALFAAHTSPRAWDVIFERASDLSHYRFISESRHIQSRGRAWRRYALFVLVCVRPRGGVICVQTCMLSCAFVRTHRAISPAPLRVALALSRQCTRSVVRAHDPVCVSHQARARYVARLTPV